jgi:glycosyl-4,4'-diaponeurosporenoate acyltransferase
MKILAIIAANVTGCPILQLAIAWAFTKMSPRRFARDYRIYGVQGWEVDLYRRRLLIRRWKRMLPDGAVWVGGNFRKGVMRGYDTVYLRQFVKETRRAEAAHWLMLACLPIFFLWNPRWAWSVMALYAMVANIPCILVQRYNREIVRRLLLRRERTARLIRPLVMDASCSDRVNLN